MSSKANSPAHASLDVTLADVLAAVQTADLPARRRQEMVSALRTVARALGKPLSQIPTRPRVLADRLERITPDAIGISRRRWNNVRSLLQASLMQVQRMAPGRHQIKLSPGWQNLADQLPSNSVKRSVSRLTHFCSAIGIEPDGFTEQTFWLFREYLDNSLKTPRKVLAITIRGFRQAQGAVPGWPTTNLEIPDRRKSWTLPFTAFPDEFSADCEAWLSPDHS